MAIRSLILILGFSFLTLACSEATPPSMPTIEVVVTPAAMLPYQPRGSFVGRLEAQENVSIQARVSGYLIQRTFKDGQIVNKGDELYVIDPAPFEASLAEAEAEVDRVEARVAVAGRNYARGKQLVESGTISASQMDELEGTDLEAKAALKAATATRDNAKINLSYSRIVAPIDGQIGRSSFNVGDLVSPESGVLTTLVNTNAMQAVFSIDEKLLLEVRNRRLNESLPNPTEQVEVLIELSDGTLYPHKGHVDFLDNRVNEGTGTIEIRATIPNPDNLLGHGQYVRVVVQEIAVNDVLMVPQATIQSDQVGDYVLTVNDENKVQRKNVELGDRVEQYIIISQGLETGENVILQGLQKVKVGQTVNVKQLNNNPASVNDSPQA